MDRIVQIRLVGRLRALALERSKTVSFGPVCSSSAIWPAPVAGEARYAVSGLRKAPWAYLEQMTKR